MKKSILTLLIITLCFSAFSCARQNVTPESSAAKSTAQVEQNVGTEPFEELKKFEPCLDVADAEGAIYERELTDILDILQEVLREAKSGRRVK